MWRLEVINRHIHEYHMTSSDLQLDSIVYVPFWIIIDFLDTAPPDSFIQCVVVKLYTNTVESPEGPISFAACDLRIKQDLVAFGIPIDYVININDLPDWAAKIAEWFSSYPTRINATNN